MPTKENRAGQQQNYIPKGHGEKSGEYTYKNVNSIEYSKCHKKNNYNYQVKHISSDANILSSVISILKKENIPNIEEILEEFYYKKTPYDNHFTKISSLRDLETYDYMMDKIYGLSNKSLKKLLKELQDGIITLDEYNYYYGVERQKANHDIYYDLKNTNPNFSKDGGYSFNCINSVIAYCLRRKGFNVEATPIEFDEYGKPISLSLKLMFDNYNPIKISSKNQYKSIIDIVDKSPDKSIFICTIYWKNERHGHVFIVEKENDKVLFLDPQSNSILDDSLFSRVELEKTQLARVDNVDLTEECCKCYRKGK